MTDKQKLIDILMDTLPEGNPWEGHVRDLVDHLIANGVTVQRWIPVTERLPEELPKDSREWSECVRPTVDVLVKMKGTKSLYTAWYSYSYKEWSDVREEHIFTNVTHWMPLPEPPKEVEDNA